MLSLIYAQQFGHAFYQRWTFISQTEQSVPLQSNTSDCGVFALVYAFYVCIGKPFNFNHSHINYFRRKICFELLNKRILGASLPEVINVPCALEPLALGFAELQLKKYNDSIKQTLLGLFDAPYCSEPLPVVKIIMEKAARMNCLREENIVVLAWAFGVLKPMPSIQIILQYVEDSLPLEMLTRRDRANAKALVDTHGKAAIILIAWKLCLLTFEESRLPSDLLESFDFLRKWQNPISPSNPEAYGQILLVEEISRYSASFLACLKMIISLM
uniref:Ubiquitin-like protease family profile domain-containing protein n=1 Tax=Ditylenchus dipsaci TaxID=166011 RepID=A0A915CWM4_9BILA